MLFLWPPGNAAQTFDLDYWLPVVIPVADDEVTLLCEDFQFPYFQSYLKSSESKKQILFF